MKPGTRWPNQDRVSNCTSSGTSPSSEPYRRSSDTKNDRLATQVSSPNCTANRISWPSRYPRGLAADDECPAAAPWWASGVVPALQDRSPSRVPGPAPSFVIEDLVMTASVVRCVRVSRGPHGDERRGLLGRLLRRVIRRRYRPVRAQGEHGEHGGDRQHGDQLEAVPDVVHRRRRGEDDEPHRD